MSSIEKKKKYLRIFEYLQQKGITNRNELTDGDIDLIFTSLDWKKKPYRKANLETIRRFCKSQVSSSALLESFKKVGETPHANAITQLYRRKKIYNFLLYNNITSCDKLTLEHKRTLGDLLGLKTTAVTQYISRVQKTYKRDNLIDSFRDSFEGVHKAYSGHSRSRASFKKVISLKDSDIIDILEHKATAPVYLNGKITISTSLYYKYKSLDLNYIRVLWLLPRDIVEKYNQMSTIEELYDFLKNIYNDGFLKDEDTYLKIKATIGNKITKRNTCINTLLLKNTINSLKKSLDLVITNIEDLKEKTNALYNSIEIIEQNINI